MKWPYLTTYLDLGFFGIRIELSAPSAVSNQFVYFGISWRLFSWDKCSGRLRISRPIEGTTRSRWPWTDIHLHLWHIRLRTDTVYGIKGSYGFAYLQLSWNFFKWHGVKDLYSPCKPKGV